MSTFEHAKFSAQEPLKQSSGLDPVNEASAGRRGTETCPASGCMMPCTGAPFTTRPTPMPVPTVMYAHEVMFASASLFFACRYSASAGALTSVSKSTGTLRTRRSGLRMSVFRHAVLGVVVMYPYVGEPFSRSTGPNEATPRASY